MLTFATNLELNAKINKKFERTKIMTKENFLNNETLREFGFQLIDQLKDKEHERKN